MSIIKVACVGKSNDELHHRCLLLSRGLLQFIKLGSSAAQFPGALHVGISLLLAQLEAIVRKRSFRSFTSGRGPLDGIVMCSAK